MFYEVLAKHYDEVFPLEQAKVMFLDSEFNRTGARRILDLACGTGTYTIALAALGYEAWGTDLEPGMIEAACQKAQREGVPARFAVGDMREPQSLGLTFDGLFCIGNSLAHLVTVDDLVKALQGMRSVLADNGAAVFQIVNFDRILARGDTDLPLIERHHLRFVRTYRPESENRLVFDSILELKEQDGTVTRLENSVALRPIRKADLERYLLAAGFADVRAYGDFKYGEYSESSQATVVVART